jgi:hypothetical protein
VKQLVPIASDVVTDVAASLVPASGPDPLGSHPSWRFLGQSVLLKKPLSTDPVGMPSKYEIPEMLKRGGGAIVNNGSVTGLVGAAGPIGKVATKHGVLGLTKSAALQYATQGIRVNAVAPVSFDALDGRDDKSSSGCKSSCTPLVN